ncbi:MAG: hypothetical protein AAFM91_15360 [Pseudomonadota bacterium]
MPNGLPMTNGLLTFARRIRRSLAAAWLAAAVSQAGAAEQMIREVTDLNLALDHSAGRIVFDLYGALWSMPAVGGFAEVADEYGTGINRPAISPDGRWLAFERCTGMRCSVELVDRQSGTTRRVLDGPWNTTMPAFSADSARLAFVSDRDGSNDIWEERVDGTGLRKRSFAADDARWPSFARHADELVWVSTDAAGSRLLRARGGAAGEVLYATRAQVEAPAFRPDGSVIVFFERDPQRRLKLLLNDGSGVVKALSGPASFEAQRAHWFDRHTLLVSAAGKAQKLQFADGGLEALPLQAFVSIAEHPPTRAALAAPAQAANRGRYVLRVGALFDSISGALTGPRDIVINDGHIAEIGPPRVHDAALTVIDDPTLTALPGLIALVTTPTAAKPAEWLERGFTQVICLHPDCDDVSQRMRSLDTTVDDAERSASIRAARDAGYGVATEQLYPDVAIGATLWLARTPAAAIYEDYVTLLRRRQAAVAVDLDAFAPADALTMTRPGRLTNRVLIAAGGNPQQHADAVVAYARAVQEQTGVAGDVLRAITIDAALETGAAASAGRIAVGNVANLILVRGDPLLTPEAWVSPVAMVERGRYLTRAGLAAAESAVARR